MSLSPNDLMLWWGVIFVRKGSLPAPSIHPSIHPTAAVLPAWLIRTHAHTTGPYRHGIFRFTISFPERYPDVAPTILFHTSIFHPLIAPLIPSAVSPGLFSLRHGFPYWFSAEGEKKLLPTPGAIPYAEPRETTAVEVLEYVKAVLDDESVLDEIPLSAAEHPIAWKAWSVGESGRGTTGGWDERVRIAVDGSTSDSALYGGVAGRGGDEPVSFFLFLFPSYG